MIIGVFDSGVGGLTVVKELLRLMPNQRIMYLGDTARTPYGTKSSSTIIDYSLEDTAFLVSQGANVVVIACHSASSVATQAVQQHFSLPVFEVVSPSIQQATSLTKRGKIGLIGTRATVASGVYEKTIAELSPDLQVFSQACPLLVPLVEEGWLKRSETRRIVKKYLRPLKERQVDTLILGCTHYPLLRGIIQEKIGKNVQIVDPAQEVAIAVKNFISKNQAIELPANSLNDPEAHQENRFFLTDLTPTTESVVRQFLGAKIKLEKAEL